MMQGIKERLKKVIQDLYGLDFDPEVTPAPGNIEADYSSNAPLKLAKELRKTPMEIAEELCAQLGAFESVCDNGSKRRSEPRNDGRERGGEQKLSISAPGFLNFTLSDEYLSAQIVELEKDFKQNISPDDPNTNPTDESTNTADNNTDTPSTTDTTPTSYTVATATSKPASTTSNTPTQATQPSTPAETITRTTVDDNSAGDDGYTASGIDNPGADDNTPTKDTTTPETNTPSQ